MPCPAKQQLRLPLLIAAAISGLMLGLQTCLAAVDPTVHTSCADKRGYETLPGMAPHYKSTANSYPGGDEDGIQGSSVNAAFEACNKDPNCIAFSSNGATANLGSLEAWFPEQLLCTWVKRAWPKKTGFKLRPFATFTVGNWTSVRDAGSAAAAEATCLANPNCTAFGTNGEYVIGSDAIFIASDERMAVYEKQACPEVFGYTSHFNEALLQAAGSHGAASGHLSSVVVAHEFCKLNHVCSGFSSDGSYIIGGVGGYVAKAGICSYVKHPCAPMRGFAAYNDIAFEGRAASAQLDRPAKDYLADVYTQCLNDPHCFAFDSMRIMWGENAPDLRWSHESAPGICLYFKVHDGMTMMSKS